jgi:LacI family transcriptional regulator
VPRRSVTLADIAKHAGVSGAAVSVVLNGARGNIGVSEETRARILAAAAELRYSPNPIAQALRRQRSGIIGFVPRSPRANPYEHPIPYQLSLHISRAAARLGYHTIEVNPSLDAGAERNETTQILLGRRVDAVILDTPRTPSEVHELVQHGVPVVQLMRPHFDIPTATITVDASAGIAAAIDYLAMHGHRRIAFLGSPGPHPIDRARLACFTAALDRHRLAIPDEYFRFLTAFTVEEGRAITAILIGLPQRPTALFVSGDAVTLGALHALHKARVRVPDDMSVISYDDALAAYLYPPVTSVAQPFAEIASRAVSLLVEQVTTQKESSAPPRVVLPTHLIVRESTQPPEKGRSG